MRPETKYGSSDVPAASPRPEWCRVEQTGWAPVAGVGCWGPGHSRGISTMLHAWWNTNMDARRSISLLIDVAGGAVFALGFAASPIPTSWPFGSITVFAVPAGLG